jgi:hypothetical protein
MTSVNAKHYLAIAAVIAERVVGRVGTGTLHEREPPACLDLQKPTRLQRGLLAAHDS